MCPPRIAAVNGLEASVRLSVCYVAVLRVPQLVVLRFRSPRTKNWRSWCSATKLRSCAAQIGRPAFTTADRAFLAPRPIEFAKMEAVVITPQKRRTGDPFTGLKPRHVACQGFDTASKLKTIVRPTDTSGIAERVVPKERLATSHGQQPKKWPSLFGFRATFIEPPRPDANVPPAASAYRTAPPPRVSRRISNELLSQALGRTGKLMPQRVACRKSECRGVLARHGGPRLQGHGHRLHSPAECSSTVPRACADDRHARSAPPTLSARALRFRVPNLCSIPTTKSTPKRFRP